MTKIINLWAGPGTGKSSTASDLFAEMKWKGYNVELVSEIAKEIVWDKHFNLLEDQWYISAQQNRRIARLVGQVEYIITDSPLLMGVVYMDETQPTSLKQCVLDIWNRYDNINFFLQREKKYVKHGRTQTEDEARQIDARCIQLLLDLQQPYTTIPANRNAKHQIIEIIDAL